MPTDFPEYVRNSLVNSNCRRLCPKRVDKLYLLNWFRRPTSAQLEKSWQTAQSEPTHWVPCLAIQKQIKRLWLCPSPFGPAAISTQSLKRRILLLVDLSVSSVIFSCKSVYNSAIIVTHRIGSFKIREHREELKTSPYFCVPLLCGLYIEKGLIQKEMPMMEHEALASNLLIEGRCFCPATSHRSEFLSSFF